MKSYVIRNVPKGSVRTVAEREIFFEHGFDLSNDIWQALSDFCEKAPSMYDQINEVRFGETPTFGRLYFIVE